MTPPGKLDPELGGWLEDLLEEDIPPTQWLIEPFIPQGSIVFFHGPTSVGKSPFTWKLATSITNGSDFFGFKPAATGNVLYYELDTPKIQILPRLRKMEEQPKAGAFALLTPAKPLNIVDPEPRERAQLLDLASKVNPVLVIINTLRKSHLMNDKDSDTAIRIYGAWRKFFPNATLLFVHHDKKPNSNPMSFDNPDNAFSGSQQWADGAQVALHITRMYSKKDKVEDDEPGDEPRYEKTKVQVKMTKSQVSDHELHAPLQLQLSSDGTNWLETGQMAYRKFFKSLGTELLRSARIKMTIERFQISKTTAYDALRGLD